MDSEVLIPAQESIIYYQLPELKKTDEISLEIKDSGGDHHVRTLLVEGG